MPAGGVLRAGTAVLRLSKVVSGAAHPVLGVLTDGGPAAFEQENRRLRLPHRAARRLIGPVSCTDLCTRRGETGRAESIPWEQVRAELDP